MTVHTMIFPHDAFLVLDLSIRLEAFARRGTDVWCSIFLLRWHSRFLNCLFLCAFSYEIPNCLKGILPAKPLGPPAPHFVFCCVMMQADFCSTRQIGIKMEIAFDETGQQGASNENRRRSHNRTLQLSAPSHENTCVGIRSRLTRSWMQAHCCWLGV